MVVVQGPAARIRERLVGLLHLNKALSVLLHQFRRRDVGVVLPRQLLVCLLDLEERAGLRYAEKVVETHGGGGFGESAVERGSDVERGGSGAEGDGMGRVLVYGSGRAGEGEAVCGERVS